MTPRELADAMRAWAASLSVPAQLLEHGSPLPGDCRTALEQLEDEWGESATRSEYALGGWSTRPWRRRRRRRARS